MIFRAHLQKQGAIVDKQTARPKRLGEKLAKASPTQSNDAPLQRVEGRGKVQQSL
jgi:hypothetical protein